MKAAIPEQTGEAARGWVFYDGDCSLCAGAAARFALLLHRHHFNLAPLQAAWVRKRIGLEPDEPLAEMKLLAADGRIYGGADALLQIARAIWWLWPLGHLLTMPGIHWLAGCTYRWVARHRYYFGGRCKKEGQRSICHRHAAFFELP